MSSKILWGWKVSLLRFWNIGCWTHIWIYFQFYLVKYGKNTSSWRKKKIFSPSQDSIIFKFSFSYLCEEVKKIVAKGERKVWRKSKLSYVYVNAIIRAFLQKFHVRWKTTTKQNRNVKVWIIYYCYVTLSTELLCVGSKVWNSYARQGNGGKNLSQMLL